jgi:hypothetical protein
LPASNTRSGRKRKGPPLPPLRDAIVPSDSDNEDYKEVNELVDAAVLSKNNPTDGNWPVQKYLKLIHTNGRSMMLSLVKVPGLPSAIWKYNYFKEFCISTKEGSEF